MRAVLVLVLVIALAAAGGAAYLVNEYLQQQARQPVAEPEPQLPVFTGQRVLVADEPIPAGSALRPSMFRWQPWPEKDILPDYKVIGDAEGQTEQETFDQRTTLEQDMSGKVTRRDIAAGEPITDLTVFEREKAGFMAGALRPGMRAITIPVNETSGAAGFILPGDRVDIILTHDISDLVPDDDDNLDRDVRRYVAETILESLRVLAVDQVFRTLEEGNSKVVSTVTVEVTAQEAEVVNLARRMGSMTLTLRSLSDRQAPVGLASLLGFGGQGRAGGQLPMVTDRSVSPALDSLLRAAAASRERVPDLTAEPTPVFDMPAPTPAPESVPDPGWTVTVYRGAEGPTTYREQEDEKSEMPDQADDGIPPPPWDHAGTPVDITPDMADEIPIEE